MSENSLKTRLMAQLTAELSREERAFLHRLSTPISTLGLLTESYLASPQTDAPPQELQTIERCLHQIHELIRERRTLLEGRCKPTA